MQLVLRRILIQNEALEQAVSKGELSDDAVLDLARRAYMANAMKYALIFIASAPMLIIYPFIQKYFVKGVMIGSVKG